MVIENPKKYCQKVRLMTTNEMNNLIVSLSHGDTAALERLYEELSKPVYFYALDLSGNNEIAEDVMQETFLTVWNKAGEFVPTGSARAWVFTIAKNKTLDKLRAAGRHEPLSSAHAASGDPMETALADMAFMQRLAPLSERERSVVVLRLLSGFTLTEVAEELHIPKGTVFWTYNTAIKKLRNEQEKGGAR